MPAPQGCDLLSALSGAWFRDVGKRNSPGLLGHERPAVGQQFHQSPSGSFRPIPVGVDGSQRHRNVPR